MNGTNIDQSRAITDQNRITGSRRPSKVILRNTKMEAQAHFQESKWDDGITKRRQIILLEINCYQ